MNAQSSQATLLVAMGFQRCADSTETQTAEKTINHGFGQRLGVGSYWPVGKIESRRDTGLTTLLGLAYFRHRVPWLAAIVGIRGVIADMSMTITLATRQSITSMSKRSVHAAIGTVL